MLESDNYETSDIEWKQDTGTKKQSRPARRAYTKAVSGDKRESNQLDVGKNRISNKSPNLRKLKTKIRDVFSDDEDEEDDDYVVDNINMSLFLEFEHNNEKSALFNGLREEEKKNLQIEKHSRDRQLQSRAGKADAIVTADKAIRKSGLKEVDREVINNNMLNVATDEKTFANTLRQHLQKTENIKIKNVGNLEDSQALIKGIKKLRQTELDNRDILDDRRIKKLDTDDFIRLGKEKDERRVVQIIVEKTGRTDKDLSEKQKVVKTKKITKNKGYTKENIRN